MRWPDLQERKGLLFLAAAVLLFFWPVWIAGHTFPQGGGDLFGQLYPVWSYVARWLRQGVFPLWSTQLMGGDPIVAEAQYGLFNPLNWPFFLFSPLPRGLLLVRGAFSLWLAGAGLYLYLKRSPVWRLNHAPALVGALAYTFSHPFIAHLGHPQFNDVLAWLPWTLWALDDAFRRSRRIPWAGLTLGLMLLAGHGQAALYGGLVVGAYALWQLGEGGLGQAPRRLGRLLLVGVLALALAAPALLPGLERLPHTERALVPFELRRGYEFPPEMLVNFLAPTYHGLGLRDFWPGWNRVESGYAGAVALYLALLGLLGGLKRRRTWFLLGLGGFAYLFALGYQGPLYAHLAPLPFFAESWKTARIMFVLSLIIAIGAALGVEQLMQRRCRSAPVWSGLLLLGGGLLWLAAPAAVAGVPAGSPQARALMGLHFAALLAPLTGLLGWSTWRGRPWGQAGLSLLLLAELVALGALVETEPYHPTEEENAPLAFLRADPGWFRVDIDGTARGLFSPSLLLAEGFEVPQGTGNPMEFFWYNQFYWAVPYKGAPAYRLFGAKYIVVASGELPGGEGIIPVFTEDPLVDIHLNTNSLPRAWLVYETVPITTIEEAYAIIFDPSFEPGRRATVQDGPQLQGSGEGWIEVLRYSPHRVRLGVHTDAPALLVLSDVLYPGWEATIDGEATPLYRTNGIFRGVVVPEGSHRVELRYAPRPFRLGVGLLGMAVLAFAVAFTAHRRSG